LVNGKPVGDGVTIYGRGFEMRIRVAVEVPGRIDKSVHRVGFATGAATALGTGSVHKFRHTGQRRTAGQGDVDVLRQKHRQVFVGNRHDAALLAIKNGDGSTPVALARDAPILQAEG